jgi:ABC-type antimicrobial peptide transport system permease subunit
MNGIEESTIERNKAIKEAVEEGKNFLEYNVKDSVKKIGQMAYSIDSAFTILCVLLWVITILVLVGGITGLLKWWF